MEIVKIRLQMQALKPVAERQSVAEVIRQLGVKGMYTGTPATLMRDVPFSMVLFPTYANLRTLLADKTTGECGPGANLLGNNSFLAPRSITVVSTHGFALRHSFSLFHVFSFIVP